MLRSERYGLFSSVINKKAAPKGGLCSKVFVESCY
jgi:hypothetical protein